jgi:hypothetical protein
MKEEKELLLATLKRHCRELLSVAGNISETLPEEYDFLLSIARRYNTKIIDLTNEIENE